MSQLLPQQAHARDIRSKFFPAQPARPASRPAPPIAKVEPQRAPAMVVPIKPQTEATCLRCPWEAMRPDGSHSQAYILAIVGHVFDIPVEDIEGPGRKADVVKARHTAMWLLYRFGPKTQRSQPTIGRRLGRDHTTVLHGLRRAELAVKLVTKPEHNRPYDWARALADLTPWPAAPQRGPSHQGRDADRKRIRTQVSSLFYAHNYTRAEVAERLGITVPAVDGILRFLRTRG